MEAAATLAFFDATDAAQTSNDSVKVTVDAAQDVTSETLDTPPNQEEAHKRGTVEIRILVDSADSTLLEILSALESKQRALTPAPPQKMDLDLRASLNDAVLGLSVKPERHRRRSLISPILLLAALLAGYALRTQVKDLRFPLGSTLSLPSMQEVVDRIVVSESHGDTTAKNPNSTALGAGQFIEATWLGLIRKHRPEIALNLSEKQILDLRKDPDLSRFMASRYAEDNTSLLLRRGLPVTPGSLYLAHFAGAAGAAAILTAPEDADAAMVIANVDARPGITREKILNGNPFMKNFTAKDLKTWAELKMQGLSLASRERD
jgi:hypothetical protein